MLRKTWLPALALMTGLILGASTTALTQTPPPAPAPAQRPAGGGRHPHIMAAERGLKHAERQLEEAAHHYGGHRAKALELVKLAEGELREAVAYAQAHPEEFKAPPTK
jgi:hypothetical protein